MTDVRQTTSCAWMTKQPPYPTETEFGFTACPQFLASCNQYSVYAKHCQMIYPATVHCQVASVQGQLSLGPARKAHMTVHVDCQALLDSPENSTTQAILTMSESRRSRLTVQDIPGRGLRKCRLQLRDYAREQSNALCQSFLTHVLLVPKCPHKCNAHRPLWLACVSECDEASSERGAFCQPQPLTLTAFDRKEIMSGCSGDTLVKLRESMIPKLIPHDARRGLTSDDLLHKLPVWATLPELDVPLMEGPLSKVWPLSCLMP